QFEEIPSHYWELGTLYVSIDGTQKQHDAFRGHNSFMKAIKFLQIARARVKKLYVNTVLFSHPENWAHSLYTELSSLRVDNWTIIAPVRQGRWFKDICTVESFETQYKYILNIVEHYHSQTTTSFLNFSKTENIF